ncbi:MAG: citrate/2-methylcitrate synthase [Myxococcota bacterium]
MEQNTKGLAGVVAGNTTLSRVDGQQGQLHYCGYNIDDLVEGPYEETCYLLLHGQLPTTQQLQEFTEDLKQHRTVPQHVLEFIQHKSRQDHPMAVLRTAVSMLSCDNTFPSVGNDPQHTQQQAMALIAQMSTLVASIGAARTGKNITAPDKSLDHAANFLAMLQGQAPSAQACQAINVALVLHADHGFNASTFAARAIASTLSDMVSAVTAAVGSLKGPLHGGANTAVMHMLQEIGQEDAVEPWLNQTLDHHGLVMGFGHRVYKTTDPRVKHLRMLSKQWCEHTNEAKWFHISEKLRELVLQKKGLHPNVDFYSASLYYALGIDPDMYTPVFALSRVAGWVGHVREQLHDNRLIRPRAQYIGHAPRAYAPLQQRTPQHHTRPKETAKNVDNLKELRWYQSNTHSIKGCR